MREGLNQMDFVIAAYAIGVVGTLAMVVWAWLAMRKAEARRDETRRHETRHNEASLDETRRP
ncbi:hypothetical protein GRI44_03550 [Altererythrobacter confluentis]|uniref:Heme exporter protein D n=1 Tax=Allopontixanthobacter confluentis TaxID=1849021 RepID=A0A6L7GEC0_9SPHN|nr:hypothetical protein [Allopontixanthobacter confluentis]MXP13825.1 hypothetical protein [Allopontixanthobacter confluentis]